MRNDWYWERGGGKPPCSKYAGDWGPTYHWTMAEESPDGNYVETMKDAVEYAERFRGAGSLLDVGCGDGYFTGLAVAGDFPCIGIDTDPVALKGASEKVPGAEFYQISAYDEFVDRRPIACAFYIDVIEHFHDPVKALQACPAKNIYVVTPLYEEGKAMSKFHPYEYTRDELKKIAQDAGFENINMWTKKQTESGRYHLLMTASK